MKASNTMSQACVQTLFVLTDSKVVLQVSEAMKKLNRKFGALHGWSSLLNLGVVVALGFHGLWLGTYGL
jgi:hypothetical protein